MEEKTLTFEEKLSKLLELAKSKKNVLDEKEVLDAFAGEELTPEKLDRIYDFLDKKHVDVLKCRTMMIWIRICFRRMKMQIRRMRLMWSISIYPYRRGSV